MYLVIGLAQCLAMIPGVSRSGTTIVSGMLLGADKRSAAEFSFLLAMPTMFGAFVYDLYKNHSLMTADNIMLVAVGFAMSFVVAWIVVKTLLDYVHAPRLRAVRVVARDRRHARVDRAGAGILRQQRRVGKIVWFEQDAWARRAHDFAHALRVWLVGHARHARLTRASIVLAINYGLRVVPRRWRPTLTRITAITSVAHRAHVARAGERHAHFELGADEVERAACTPASPPAASP